MPPKKASKARPSARKMTGQTDKKTAASKKQSSKKPASKPCSIFMLSNEIIAMIFEQLGRPPKQAVYTIDDLNDVHPCWAICSTSKFFRQWYVKTMGKSSKEIEITLLPRNYLDDSEDIESTIKQSLRLLGHEGVKRITKCHVVGSVIGCASGNAIVDKWFNAKSKTNKRLDPEHKTLIKQHIEEAITNHSMVIRKVFASIDKLFNGLTELKVSPHQLPITVWHDPVKQYVLKNHNKLTEFSFVPDSPRSWKRNFIYIDKLTKTSHFPTRAEQPSNYPESIYLNRTGFQDLQGAIVRYLSARKNLEKFTGEFENKDIKGHAS